MNELYKFGELDKRLTEWGFPAVNKGNPFQIIKAVDFAKAYRAGSISFEKNEIYLEYEGKKYQGYMHRAESYFSRYNSHPKFHLIKCHTIQQFISSGTFKEKYVWSNSNKVDLIDDRTGEIYKDSVLTLCSFCKRQLYGSPQDTQAFFDKLDKTQIEQATVEIDIFGYVKGWERISRAYRKEKDYTCELCGIKPVKDFDKRYWHTHHRNGDKTNNKPSNLECLCVLCHSHRDHSHEENFDKARMKRELDSFVNQYREELKNINNPYLRQYST